VVSFTGINSGIDAKQIINAMMNAQRAPVRRLEAQRSSFQAQISALGKVTSQADSFKRLLEEMRDDRGVLGFTATSSEEDVVNASVTGDASSGRYSLEVHELAVAEKQRSAGLNSPFSQVRAGTLTIAAAGHESVEITIGESDSLRDVVNKINASGARVDASLITAGGQSYLQLVATDYGHEVGGDPNDALVITEDYTGAEGNALGLTQVVQARNAVVELDGLMVEQRENTLSDVIAGLSIELTKKGTTTLDIAADRAGTKERLQEFVDGLNDLVRTLSESTVKSDGARQVGADPILLRLRSDIRGRVVESAPDVPGSFTSLSQIGILTDSRGRFKIDSAALDKALDADLRSIGALFSHAESGVADRLIAAVERYTDSVDGALGNRRKALEGRIRAVDSQVERLEVRLERTAATMQRQFTAMERAMSGFQLQQGALNSLLMMGF